MSTGAPKELEVVNIAEIPLPSAGALPPMTPGPPPMDDAIPTEHKRSKSVTFTAPTPPENAVVEVVPDNLQCNEFRYTAEENGSMCDGTGFMLNKVSYGWRDLKKFTQLEEFLATHRLQQHLFSKVNHNKPTMVSKPKKRLSIRTPPVMDVDSLEYQETVNNQPKVHVAVCLPCYDEEWCEMSGTLRSLASNILVHRKRPDRSFQLHITVIIIQDGWGKASSTLKDGIATEWGAPNQSFFTNKFKEEKEGIIITCPDSELYYPTNQHDAGNGKGIGATIYPIFVTKSKNAQKFNSHLIFFSLMSLLKPHCVYLTDCGTVYNPDCLHKLVEYLCKKKDGVIGVTARQRVMGEKTRREVQEYPHWWKDYEGEDAVSSNTRFWQQLYWWLCPAPLQGFEFESTFLLNTAMFNVMGALPVLPGPCQLIWWDHLESRDGRNGEGPLDMYFRHLEMDRTKSNIIKISTLLAEDRILSFTMILRTLNLTTISVAGATFSYEPMITWVQLLGQRRRWVNGTLACYIFYLNDTKGQEEVAMSIKANNRALHSLWGLQLYQSFLQILSPAFFSIAVFESIVSRYEAQPQLFAGLDSFLAKSINRYISPVKITTPIFVGSLYFLLYFIWVILAMTMGKKPNFMNKTFYLNMMETTYWIFSFLNAVVSSYVMFEILASSASPQASSLAISPVALILIIIWVIPFVLALVLSFSSALLYLSYGIPFLMQLPMYVTFIPAFAFARMHDLSWGNRDSNAHQNDGSEKALKRKESQFWWFNFKMNVLSVGGNGALFAGYMLLITQLGHLEAIFFPFFIVLFTPTVIQIFFAGVYLGKMVLKSIIKRTLNMYEEIRHAADGDSAARSFQLRSRAWTMRSDPKSAMTSAANTPHGHQRGYYMPRTDREAMESRPLMMDDEEEVVIEGSMRAPQPVSGLRGSSYRSDVWSTPKIPMDRSRPAYGMTPTDLAGAVSSKLKEEKLGA